jgi:hypothetical protein
MKSYRFLAVISVLILFSMACSFSDRWRKIRVIDRLIGDNSADVESAPQDVAQEFTDDPVRFSCQAESLESYMGENWKFSPVDLTDLILEVSARGDRLEYSISFSSNSDFIVETNPNYRPPPGVTLVPDGIYDFVEEYQGAGAAQLKGEIFSGKINVDYKHILQFPDPDIKIGSLEFPVLALINMGDIEICFGVLPDQVDTTAKDPGTLLRPNCRWPGYIFACTVAQ